MFRLPRLLSTPLHRRTTATQGHFTARSRALATLGNISSLVGVVVLLYAGGRYATEAYGRYAARGDTDVPAPRMVTSSLSEEPAPFRALVPTAAPFAASAPAGSVSAPSQPVEQSDLERHAASLPSQPVATVAPVVPEVTRLIIPSIALDAKVIGVDWEMEDVGGADVPVWQVASYAVGQHAGSANPGDGGNIVLAGHVAGLGHVFRDLYYVHPGDEVTLYRNDTPFQYTVLERLIVDEENVSDEQRAENAQLIGATDEEMITMVTCWPPTGPDKFTQRVVIRALPAQ